jgi:hypothetical protein
MAFRRRWTQICADFEDDSHILGDLPPDLGWEAVGLMAKFADGQRTVRWPETATSQKRNRRLSRNERTNTIAGSRSGRKYFFS